MSTQGYKFVDWLITNDDGEWAGLRDDAPPEAVEAYNAVMALPDNQYDEKTGMIINY